MSSVCIFVVGKNECCVIDLIRNKVSAFAASNDRGANFCIGWEEPLCGMSLDGKLVISINDSPTDANCEMLLLPDNWHFNGVTNSSLFCERAAFLRGVADILLEFADDVELYIFESGSLAEDLAVSAVKTDNLVKCLAETVGKNGADLGVHFVLNC